MLYMLQVKSYVTEVNFLKSNLTCNNVHVAETKFVNSEKKNYFITDRMFDNITEGKHMILYSLTNCSGKNGNCHC